MVYEPLEDSFMLKNMLKKHIKKTDTVLDMGSGSGIQAIEASKYTKEVVAADIDSDAIKYIKSEIKKQNITNIKTKKTDLFSNINQKFDIIIFNPPYLPYDKNEPEESRLATTGGKHGYETIEKFLNSANDHLNENGKILLLFSNLSIQEKVDEIIKENLFEKKQISEKSMFFEKLYIYEIKKSKILKELKQIKNIKKLTHGHRGAIYTGLLKTKKITIKIQRTDIDARNTVNNESNFLKKLNKLNIGPKLIKAGDNYFIYKFIEGEFIEKYIKENTKTNILKIIKNLLTQCFTLDNLSINKEEMHNPYKHILIENNEPIMIDFERASYTHKPKNITQFIQYLTHIKTLLIDEKINIDEIKLRLIAKQYKQNINKDIINKIIKEIK